MANPYTNKSFDLTTTALTTVYTCPANTTALVKTIQMTNDSGTVNVEVYLADTSASTEVEIAHLTMSARSTDNFAYGTIVLEAGDSLKVQAATGSTVTGVLSILEIDF